MRRVVRLVLTLAIVGPYVIVRFTLDSVRELAREAWQ